MDTTKQPMQSQTTQSQPMQSQTTQSQPMQSIDIRDEDDFDLIDFGIASNGGRLSITRLSITQHK
jgi:hypothetical protein